MVIGDKDLLSPAEMRRLARLGVEVEIARLHALIDQLEDAYPQSPAARHEVKRRRKMTKEARRAISLRMKQHWKERRKANASVR